MRTSAGTADDDGDGDGLAVGSYDVTVDVPVGTPEDVSRTVVTD